MAKKDDCIFCKIASKEQEADIIAESDNFLAFPDANPVGPGHSLIIPKNHFVNIMDLPSDLGSELLDIIKEVAAIRLKEGFEGFKLVANNFPVAGQIVMHSHFHLIPRKEKDGVESGAV